MSFKYGLVAGAASVIVDVLLKITLNTTFKPEIIAQAIISITPAPVSYTVIAYLGSASKYLALLLGVVLLLCFYGLLGAALSRINIPQQRRLIRIVTSIILAYCTTLGLTFFLYYSIVEVGVLQEPYSYILHYIPSGIVFGLLFGASSLDQHRMRMAPADTDRRLLLKRLIFGIPVVAAILSSFIYLTSFKSNEKVPKSQIGEIKSLTDYELTPTQLFFTVSVNVVSPVIDVEKWMLKVGGLVNKPLQLRLEDIKAMRQVEEYVTLECVSNPIGGDLISTAHWRGVTLRSILEKAEIKGEAKYVVFRCFDGYSVGIPLQVALDERTILAYDMNNQPLTPDHGYPLRLVTPKYYGMMNPKWITEIEVVDDIYLGFWQRLGWANEAEYHTHSTIVVPGSSPLRRRFGLPPRSQEIKLGDKVQISGVAFAGDRGISKVEVSLDGGSTWLPANIKKPLSKFTWVIWWLDWEASALGAYMIKVRATDGYGNLQAEDLSEPFPKGATGYHTIVFHVETT